MTFENFLTEIDPRLAGILIVGISAFAGYILHRVATAIATGLVKRTPTRIDDIFLANIRRPTGLLLPPAVALLTLPLAPPSDLFPYLRHALIILVITAIGWGCVKLLRAIGEIVIDRFRIDRADNLAQRQIQTRVLIINRVGATVVILITVAMVLMTFPSVRQVGISLFASAGVAGLVIGLAARSAIANVIAGIQVALAQPIRVDDVVIVEGEWGWIEEITMTFVVVRIWDQRRLMVPLNYFIEKPFQNWTRKTADIIGTIFLHADYTVPVGELRDELSRLAKDHPKWDGKVCNLQVTDATPRTVELRALVSAANSPDAWDLRCDLREGLIAYLQERHPECLPRVRAEIEDDGGVPAKGSRAGG